MMHTTSDCLACPPPPPRRLPHLRPFALPAAMVVAGVVVGGVPGFIVGFVAALVAVDRALGSAGASRVEAEHRFRRLSRERRRAELVQRLRRRPAAGLEYLADDVGWVAVAPRRRLGLQTIAIDSIAGTTDRQKSTAFDAAFRPPAWSRGRWTLLLLAAQRGTELPPISVYRVGDRHYVRDGHHRVSVARAMDAASIEAQVVALSRTA
jgi:hypothetical protein